MQKEIGLFRFTTEGRYYEVQEIVYMMRIQTKYLQEMHDRSLGCVGPRSFYEVP